MTSSRPPTGPGSPARPRPEDPRLTAGDELYHVVEIDLPDDGGVHTWEVASRRVAQVRSDGGFVFDRVHGFARVHRPHLLGTTYHRTPQAAVQAFVATQQRRIESARRALAEAERALGWAGVRLPDPQDRGTP